MKRIKTVLIVEDDLMNRELEATLFKRAGHTVLEADDANTGMAIAADKIPDLIILDCQLPGISGTQFLEKLSNNPKTSSIPCLFVTASSTSEQIKIFRSSRACGYITKPINIRTFVAQALELAGNSRSEETLTAKKPIRKRSSAK